MFIVTKGIENWQDFMEECRNYLFFDFTDYPDDFFENAYERLEYFNEDNYLYIEEAIERLIDGLHIKRFSTKKELNIAVNLGCIKHDRYLAVSDDGLTLYYW